MPSHKNGVYNSIFSFIFWLTESRFAISSGQGFPWYLSMWGAVCYSKKTRFGKQSPRAAASPLLAYKVPSNTEFTLQQLPDFIITLRCVRLKWPGICGPTSLSHIVHSWYRRQFIRVSLLMGIMDRKVTLVSGRLWKKDHRFQANLGFKQFLV